MRLSGFASKDILISVHRDFDRVCRAGPAPLDAKAAIRPPPFSDRTA